MEQADGVGAAADAGDQRVRQPALRRQDLLARLGADHRLEVADHRRIGMRPGDGADQVVGVVDVGDPVAQRLVHRVLQRAGAGRHRPDLGAQQLHAKDVRRLPLDVGRAHVDLAGEAEQGADGGGGDAVLAGAGLGDDPRLAHAARQQDLAQRVVDLVRAGVVELVALEVDLRAAEPLGQPLREVERARPADVVLQVVGELLGEGGVGARLVVGALDLEDQRHQRLGDEAAAVDAEMAAFVRSAAVGVDAVHACPSRLVFAGQTVTYGPRARARGDRRRTGRGLDPRRRGEEGADQRDALVAGRVFDAGRDIDGSGAAQPHRVGEVAGISPPASSHGRGQTRPASSRQSKLRRCRPAASLPPAAGRRTAAGRRPRHRLRPRRQIAGVGDGDRLDHRQPERDAHRGHPRRAFAAVQLQQIERHRARGWRAIVASSASTTRPTRNDARRHRPPPAPPRPPALSARGDGGKNTKPTSRAPPVTAASSAAASRDPADLDLERHRRWRSALGRRRSR